MDNTYTDGWIGIDEAAKYMDVTKDTVRNWIKKTDIPAHKIDTIYSATVLFVNTCPKSIATLPHNF